MQIAAVIVAAGRGRRAGAGMPKQWRPLNGRVMLAWTLSTFRRCKKFNKIVLVLHPDDLELGSGYSAHRDVVIIPGGDSRSASVRSGLEALSAHAPDRVLIHDVARPLVSDHLIETVIEALEHAPAAAPALEVTDALWRGSEGYVTGTQDRSGIYRAQTPQGFHYAPILAAHRQAHEDAADDVEIAARAGLAVRIVPGDPDNIKITRPQDFARAEKLMETNMQVRFGHGFDVHALIEGDGVILCGVELPHHMALSGHSDADVGMHALTDALYGALAEGDIGQHFPPSDPRWRGAASEIFLTHAMERVRARGFEVANMDVTLICEAPKIGPHASAMVAQLARITDVSADRISVKATTTERLGFAGRREGIAAMATAALVGR